MPSKCPDCQTTVPDDALFCPKCGAGLRPTSVKSSDRDNDDGDSAAATLRRTADRLSRPDDPEGELWQGGFSIKSMIGSWVSAGLFTILALIVAVAFSFTGVAVLAAFGAILAVWLWVVGVYFYRRFSVHYTLTSQRFVHASGLLTRRTDRIEVIDIDDVTFKQGLIERFLNVGTIELESSDRTDPTLVLRGIDDVARVAGLIDDARRAERRKRGLHIEEV